MANHRHLLARLVAGTHGVRVRTTAVATVVVAVTLAVGAVATVSSLRRTLTNNVETAASEHAEDVADSLGEPGGDAIEVADVEEQFVQVLDADGAVIASSSNVAGKAPVARLSPGDSQTVEYVPIEDDPFLLVAVAAEDGTTVISGRTLEEVAESTATLVGLLAMGLPLLLIVLAAVTWLVVGRALMPVGAMRAEVDSITAAELDKRVPEPQSRDEIGRLATTMNQMLARLEASQERQRRFVSDASHEMRSPVSTIRHHAEVALAHPDGVSVPDLASVVLEEDLRIQALVDDLLLLASLDEEGSATRSEPVDLDDLVFETARRLNAGSGPRVDVSGVGGGRVAGDKGRLSKLVGNLLDNAVRHAHAKVIVALAEHEDTVVLRVDDDGTGIDERDRTRIFERFVRLDAARGRDAGGSGLGLAIVAEVARTHGATVEVGDSPSSGARFEVSFAAVTD